MPASPRPSELAHGLATLALTVATVLAVSARSAPAMAATTTSATGSVSGVVQVEPAPAPVVAPRYRVRTRAPIETPDPQPAIVYLERADGRYPPAAEAGTLVVAQRGYQFRPAVAAVRSGARVTFPNQDDEFHSVFSYSSAKRFDLGRFRKDESSPEVVFDQPGLIKIYCEIHKHMRSLVLVLDTPWFTATDADGAYRLDGIPAGDYRLKVFFPDEATIETAVTVASGAELRRDLPAP